ncbi:MAG: solute:sodium symporter family transporter [Thermoguttaceae bacterium]|jgi:SSS family solute:Na+ symporter|nr:solute:sodium symporter family transporter [Thermoguttaceae bacterium]
MDLNWIDVGSFVLFLVVVVGVSLYASRREQTGEDYFLAGRKLTWWLIGFSLIASNISTEHFVGMAGQAFGRVGLAIASYEWMAAVTLVIVAWWLLPRFLRVGIYTMPEFLEYRFDSTTRSIMATYLMAAYIIVFLATVLYSGAQGLNGVFGFPDYLAGRFGLEPDAAMQWATIAGIWFIGLVAGAYTIYGGLKAVVWSDLIQGGALLFGGGLMLYLGLRLCGGGALVDGGGVAGGSMLEGWSNFTRDNEAKLHTVLAWNDPDVPWLAVFIGGLWIPNLFYWGMNQFITQRTLGAKSLAEGQKGIFLACVFKLAIPFIIVMPGIMAFDLFGDAILAQAGGNIDKAGEIAYPHLIARIMPPHLRGIMLAALAGAVMSSFNSGLNSAATIFTIDLYGKHVDRTAGPRRQVLVGRVATAAIVVLACLWAPVISRFEGVFRYIQEIWGFITPGIVAAFLVGLIFRRTPPVAAKAALLLSPVLYALSRIPGWVLRADYEWRETAEGVWQVTHTATGQAAGGLTALLFSYSTMAFLHHMGIIFLVLAAMMLIVTKFRPLEAPATYPRSNLDTTPHPLAYVYGTGIIAVTILLYIVFW